jgi:hypothetical protein
MSSCQICQSQLDKSAFVLVGFALPPPTIRLSCIWEGAELNLALAAAAHPFGPPWGQHLRYLSHAHACICNPSWWLMGQNGTRMAGDKNDGGMGVLRPSLQT